MAVEGGVVKYRRNGTLLYTSSVVPTRTAQNGYAGGDGVRQQFTQKERNIETGLDYFLARYYSSLQGRFTGVDPKEIAIETNRTRFLEYVGNPQNWNRYSYVLNNPLLLLDPDGREPNKAQAVTIQQIVAIVEQTERGNPNLGPREILERVDGFFQAQRDNPGDPRYVYTEERGWIDFKHFFAAANQAASVGQAITNTLGLAVEVIQTVTRNPSAFSYEDLASNAAGADFGDNVFDPNGAPLSEQVASYVNALRPTAPTAAPNFASLPEQVDLGSRVDQSSGSRAPGTSSTSTRQPGIGSSGPGPANAPSSSNGPKARKVTTSSGRTPDE